MFDGAPVFGGSEVLLFSEEGQHGSLIGGKEEGFWWVHFAGDQVLRLVNRCNGGGDGGSKEGGFCQNVPGWSEGSEGSYGEQ